MKSLMDLQKKSHQNYDYDDYSDRDDCSDRVDYSRGYEDGLDGNECSSNYSSSYDSGYDDGCDEATAMTTAATMAGDYRPAGSRLASLESAGLFFLAVSPWRFCGIEGNSKCRQW